METSDSEGAKKERDTTEEGAGEVSQGKLLALPPPPPGLPASYPRQGKPTIRKGVYLSALVYVEGERPPALDFAAEAKEALQHALDVGLSGGYKDLSITLKRISVENNLEDEEGEEGEAGPQQPTKGPVAGTRKRRARANAGAEEKFDF